LFHAIDRGRPSILIDEGDTFITKSEDLRGLLDSGHARGATFLRAAKRYETWAPKVIALIDIELHPSIVSRSVRVELNKKLPDEQVEALPRENDAYLDLFRKCLRWAEDNRQALAKAGDPLAWPKKKLDDRTRDNWRPLLNVAEACGGRWPVRARIAASHLSEGEDEDRSILLLRAFRRLFKRGKVLSSSQVVEALNAMEHRPWPEFNHRKGISGRDVAKLLRPFKIAPEQVAVGRSRPNGYHVEQFASVFERYLPSASSQPADAEHAEHAEGQGRV
jgi:hypothetical protein